MKRGTQLGRWRLLRPIGRGGNGDVWKCQASGDIAALKLLRPSDDRERFGRFKNEIQFLLSCGNVRGVLPLLDHSLPDDPKAPAWYVMPMATPLLKALGSEADVPRVLEVVVSIGGTLAALAEQGVAHRDIKPDNLFLLGNEWVIGDFGLVAYPEQDRLTRHGRKVGPIDYMAPEMRESADTADPQAADVYSLAKTTWVLLTGQRYPFSGPHLPHIEGYSLARQLEFARAPELDLLLERATHHIPRGRPTMAEFVDEIRAAMIVPPERVQIPNMDALQRRIASLTEQRLRDDERVGKYGRLMTTSFDRLRNEAMLPACDELARILPSFRRMDLNGPYALKQIPGDINWYPKVYWEHDGGETFVAPGSGPPISATLAVGLRVHDDNGPSTQVGVMRVHDAGMASEPRDVWLKVSDAPLGSAQFEQTFVDFANGFVEHLPDLARAIAEFLARR